MSEQKQNRIVLSPFVMCIFNLIYIYYIEMTRGRHYGVLVLLLLHAEYLHSFVNVVCPFRTSERNPHGDSTAAFSTPQPCSSSQPVRWMGNMSQRENHVQPGQRPSAVMCSDSTNSWITTARKVLLSSCLTASLVLSGVVPGSQLEFRSTERNFPTVTTARHEQRTVVPAAVAASFNDEQRTIAETWRTVDRLYVDRTFGGQDWFALRQQALKAGEKGMTEAELSSTLSSMLATLGDRYTRYLPPAKYATIVQSSSGDVAGVGVSLSMDKDRDLPLIVGVEAGTPAEEAGLQARDLLVKISGDDCQGLAPDDAAALLRGSEGTKVGIVAERPASSADGAGKAEKLDLIVTRRKFKVEGVVSEEATIGGRKVGIVRIKSFSSNTAGDVQAAVDRLKGKGASRFVVDLRGNVGGLLPAGIDTAGLFLDSGKDVVFIIRKNGSVEARTTAEKGRNADGPPLTILVDKGTASASEVFAAAVRENDRATLVGQQTFGKGVIQTVEPLSSGGGVAVTVARYETPLHHNINKVGIPVDKEIDCPVGTDAATCDM